MKIVNNAENLGEVLRGDRIENSVYTFQMREDLPCKVACKAKLNAESAKAFKEKIDDEYRVNMILDNLPVVVLRLRRDEVRLRHMNTVSVLGSKEIIKGAQRRNILSVTT